MRVLPSLAYIVFGCLYLALLAFHVRSAWRTYRSFPGVKSFQFYLLDMVAAVMGISPTVWLVARAIEGSSYHPLDAWLCAAAAGLSQVTGMFIGRIHGTVPPQQPPNEWIDALWVLGGACYGLLLLAVSFVAFVIAYTIALFMFHAGPAYALLLVGFVALMVYAVYLHT